MKKCAYLLILISVFTLGLAGYKLILCAFHPIKYKTEIEQYSKKLDLSPSLVASVINVESSYRHTAKSTRDAIGLMQIKLSTAKYLCEVYKTNENLTEADLYNANTNIKYGCLYLRYLIDKFQDTNTALAGYNAGETRVRAWLKDEAYSSDGETLKQIPYQETHNYVKKVNNNLKFYNNVF